VPATLAKACVPSTARRAESFSQEFVMESTAHRAIAIVGVGAILPDAPNAQAFWNNIKKGRYSVTEVDRDRWDPKLYYDPDPKVPDKTYSKIGGWVRDSAWEPMKWHLAIPPRVADGMDPGQKWAVACTREVLEDYGYPKRALDPERTAVILGNAMGGEKHYFTTLRIYFPECARYLESAEHFAALPEEVRREIMRELHERMARHLPEVTEDTMPGELSNCIAGRIANIFNFHGPNYVCDAACASAMAAISSAIEGLIEHHYDAVITGGIDRNMGAPSFVKFCKIGALSASGSRPYAQGADGFVMGEGAALFLMKRLTDAEKDGDRVYAVICGIGGSSDGKGKGITAPNPVGQRLAVQRSWEIAGLSPGTVTYIEGHGTSTRVGDIVELQSMADVLTESHLPPHSVAIGSVKSNFGHLKSAAGAAGLLKATFALHEKVLPPSVHCEQPNPEIDFAHSPLYVNTELKPWDIPAGGIRRAGLSAFGFGGTNFHAVLEEYIPHRLNGNGRGFVEVSKIPEEAAEAPMITNQPPSTPSAPVCKAPLHGALVIGAASEAALVERLRAVETGAAAGRAPSTAPPAEADLRAEYRLAIDYLDSADLREKAGTALKAFRANQPIMWKALRAQGIYRGQGPAPKVAFLYPGQGSQYLNMLKPLCATEPIVADTFAEADRVMEPILGKPLTEFVFIDKTDPDALAKAEDDLRQTAVTQPAVLTVDLALTRLLEAYGITPDFAMGHSLGEYGALVAVGGLPFADALEAVAARGREMTHFAMKDNGRMAAVFAPLPEIERILKTVAGNVVIANINSEHQAVIGGASQAVEEAMRAFQSAGYEVSALNVSHAFHTSIVSAASEPLRRVLARLRLSTPKLPIVANTSGEFYPVGSDVVPMMLDILAQQVAAPVQFVKGLRTLYDAGARVFVEVGPKKALQGFAEDVLGSRGDIVSVFTNHPKNGDIPAFNQALCCLYAAGLGKGVPAMAKNDEALRIANVNSVQTRPMVDGQQHAEVSLPENSAVLPESPGPSNGNRYVELGRMFADVLEKGYELYHGSKSTPPVKPVAITGAALGLPGTDHIFDTVNIARLLRGEQFIDAIPVRLRQMMLDKHITRLVKSEDGGAFESITDVADVIKLAGRGGAFDLENEFGISAERNAALDRDTRLAIAVGIDALRDAGIPLVVRYKTTSKGTKLPECWSLPECLRDDTGVIFASAFPGLNSFAEEMSHYFADRTHRDQLASLQTLRARISESNGYSGIAQEIDHRIEELCDLIQKQPYVFDRRFLFRVLSMGHSQFAEYIGARGPNTAINSACASTTQAVALSEDWIRAGRCNRVIVVAADDITSDHLLDWMGAGFLATGAAATDDVIEKTAIPFDRRRHGMIIGMGAAGIVVESAEAAGERGLQPICDVVSAVTANSAFHGTRLDVQHISQVMEELIRKAEANCGIERHEIAPRTVFVSHETYTPARGGSAAAEIHALRKVFGKSADQIVIANTKGFTGHAMGAGIEDVLAVKALETGIVPPVANFKEVDPELGELNLSKGGVYPVDYALRLGAGFGSQISMTLLRWVPTKDRVRAKTNALGHAYRITDQKAWEGWLSRVSDTPNAALEVVHHTLRVRDKNAPANLVAPETVQASWAPSAETRQEQAATATGPSLAPFFSRETAFTPTLTAAPVKAESSHPVAKVLDPEKVPVPAAIKKEEPVAQPRTAGDSVKEHIIALVVEKTGYPADMLDLDLDLEADLGVDTVKQAEMFAAIREIYNIPRDENRKLRDYPTLAHVIRFVYEKRPDLAPAEESVLAVAPAAGFVPSPPSEITAAVECEVIPAIPPGSSEGSVKERILALAVEKTGYPKDMLDLDLDLEADLGVDTVKQAEMFAAIREIYSIPRYENRKLRDYPTLAHVIRFVYEQRPDLLAHRAEKPARIPESKTKISPELTKRGATSVPGPIATQARTEAVSADADAIREKVLDIVAEKTGYPKEMLDSDLDLEADLGIDTVKQAEMFAAIRTVYNIPRDENLKLRDFPTLAHVIKFAQDRSSLAIAAARPQPARTVGAQEMASATKPRLLTFDAAKEIPRRVPIAVLRPPLDLCKPTGATLERGQRVILMPDKAGVADSLMQILNDKRIEVLRIDPSISSDALVDVLKTWAAAGPIHGVYWLPALDIEGDLREMNVNSWREAVRVRIKLLYTTMRALYGQIAVAGSFLISASRLGGNHGYDDPGAIAPLGGAVVGFTKTYKRERPEATVKAVDFEAVAGRSEIAKTLINETLTDPGAIEIGIKNGLRWSIGMEEQPASDGNPGLTLDHKTVFLITGAAGSIVSAITGDLAAASSGIFYLLDRVPEPDPKNPDLKRFVTDKEGLKRELFARIQASGERATPALVEKEIAALERAQAAQAAIDAVRNAGGSAHYCCVDLTDPQAVAGVVNQIRKNSGRIDVLLHAAGLDRSRSLVEKEPREFDLVFDVKADGFFNVLRAIGEMPVSAVIAFSSIAGRFGNPGQTDYSSANDLLCKIISSFRTTRPATRGIAIDWTAWGGIGMATRGSIPKIMEMAGIDMLSPEAGVPLIRRELTTGGTRGEVVIGQRLGVLLKEWDEAGGVDVTKLPAEGPMLGKIVRAGLYSPLTIETTLDPKVQPFLYDHQIDGTPVLPGVMGIEAFAETALALVPGWHIEAIEDVSFLAPFKFYRHEPRTVTVEALVQAHGDGLIFKCRLIGQRTLPNQADPQLTTHFTGRVLLTKQIPEPISANPVKPEGSVINASDVYKIYFHGPAYRVVQNAWWNGQHMIGLMAEHLPANHHPPELRTSISPRLVELCFQTAGIWEMGMESRMGLPLHIDHLTIFPQPEDSASGALHALVTRKPEEGGFDAEVIDSRGNRLLRLSGYHTIAIPDAIDAKKVNALRTAMSPSQVAA
jgi:acyl transferase domain-containing protein/NAD(P)-dependent dehydrogenase (short-subunit alcohol dehydrogenase family)